MLAFNFSVCGVLNTLNTKKLAIANVSFPSEISISKYFHFHCLGMSSLQVAFFKNKCVIKLRESFLPLRGDKGNLAPR